MTQTIRWIPLSGGNFGAQVGPYTLVAGEFRDRDGAWYTVFYGSEKYTHGQAMTIENAQTMAENSIR